MSRFHDRAETTAAHGISRGRLEAAGGLLRTCLTGSAASVMFLLAGGASSMGAQVGPTARDGRLPALRIDTETGPPVRVDGLLSEPFWERASVIDDFHQREPAEGAVPTERTEVRVVYDREALYVGVVAHDTEPDRVVARLLQRDRVMTQNFFGTGVAFTGDDGIAILLDPFHDHRSGVVLATNPNGAEFDALITDEGSEVNVDWRGVWEVAATRTAGGWSAEFAIPWRTLRYPETAAGEEPRPWGFNVFRMVQRKREEVLWRSWDREGGGFNRVSQAGHLVGLRDLPRPGLNLEAKPFVLTGLEQVRGPDGAPSLGADVESDGEVDVGLDLKSELRPGLVLDLTVNTDFAQVEVDDQQVNLTRFNLFFPEKRDFFLENAGIFEFGQRGQFETPPFLMFFSRRIGISRDGEVPLLGGARVTGRVGGQTVGFLSAVTDDAHGRSGEVFNVARVKRDVGESDYLGAMITDRRGGDGPWNTVAGVDGQIYLHPTLALEGYWARTFTEGAGGNGQSFQASLDLTTDPYGAFLQHFSVSPDARAEAGFVTRTDIRRTQLFLRRRIRPDWGGLRLVDFRSNGQYQSTTDGRFQDWSWGPALAPTWNSGDNLTLSATFGESRVDEGFPLADTVFVPAGRYRTDGLSASFSTTSARPWSLRGNLGRSDFFGGRLVSWGGSLTVAPSPAVAATASFNRNDVEVPGGDFTADISSLSVSYAFSTKLTTDALVQYNSLADDLVTNVRLNFIHRPGSDLFLVFTEERGVEGELWELADRGVVAKLTYLMRF